MVSMTRHQLRAARALLVLHQEVLAEMAGVGVATLRRFENGNVVGEKTIDKIRRVIEAEGAVLVTSGSDLDGRVVGAGVVLWPEATLPESTRERHAALDRTSEQAAEELSPGARDKVGRRSRVPPPSTVRRRAEHARAADAKAERVSAKAKRAAAKAAEEPRRD